MNVFETTTAALPRQDAAKLLFLDTLICRNQPFQKRTPGAAQRNSAIPVVQDYFERRKEEEHRYRQEEKIA